MVSRRQSVRVLAGHSLSLALSLSNRKDPTAKQVNVFAQKLSEKRYALCQVGLKYLQSTLSSSPSSCPDLVWYPTLVRFKVLNKSVSSYMRREPESGTCLKHVSLLMTNELCTGQEREGSEGRETW